MDVTVVSSCDSTKWFDGLSCDGDPGLQVYFEATWVGGIILGVAFLIFSTIAFFIDRDIRKWRDKPSDRKKRAQRYVAALVVSVAMILAGPLMLPLLVVLFVLWGLRFVAKDLRA